VLPYTWLLSLKTCEKFDSMLVFAPHTGHLPDHPSERDPVDDGAEDLIACHPPGRAAQIRGKKLPGAR